MVWTDSHCHVHDAADPRRHRRGRRRRSRSGRHHADHRRLRSGDIARRDRCRRRPPPTSTQPSGCTPTMRSRASTRSSTCSTPRGSWPSARPGSTTSTTTHRARSSSASSREQIQLANDRHLALVIHSRDAWDDTFDVLADAGVPERTVFHCFTGGPDEARRALDIGATLSFSGIVTFKGAPEVQAAATICPLDRLLVETDSPYLAPVPHRGRPNRPAWVPTSASSSPTSATCPSATSPSHDRQRHGVLRARLTRRRERRFEPTDHCSVVDDRRPDRSIGRVEGYDYGPSSRSAAHRAPARRIDEQPWHSPHPTDAASCWRVR